jgi:hypothetical protein
MIYLAKAIKNLRPTSEFSYDDDDYSTINWIVLDGDAPTQDEIDVEINRIKSVEITDAQTKAAQRQALLTRLGLTAEEAQLLLGGN